MITRNVKADDGSRLVLTTYSVGPTQTRNELINGDGVDLN